MREKIKKSLLILAMAITVLPMLKTSVIKVEAKTEYNHYNFACPAYEVDTISDSGEFVLSSCQGSFAEAKAAMNNAGPDAVVRSRTTYSANWIVAMTRGYAYSYSVREGVYTVTLRQNTTSSNAQTTYVNNCRMMLYKDTSSYNGDGTGTVLVDISGFEGNAELKQLDLVPSKFVDRGLPIWMGGNDITVNPDTEWQVIPRRPYYTAETNGNYTDLVCYSYSSVPNNSGTATDITYGGMSVGVAPTWMEKGKKYYSWDDTNFYSDPELKNYVNTYYNYYQFVSYRTKSRIPSSVYNSYLSNAGRSSTSKLWDMGDRFLSDQENYGINAAMVFVQACDESAYGTSNYALNRNNLFGVAAYDSNPDDATDFSSAGAAIDYQMSVLLKNYCNTNAWVYNGDHFGNKGSGITVKYASSSYYGLVLSAMYYDFDKFANGYSGNLTDYSSACVGVVADRSSNIYSSPNESNVMFTTEYTPTYQKDYTVSILGTYGDYYKVQSTDYVENGSTIALQWGDVRTYNWNSMVGYIKKSDIKTTFGAAPSASEEEIHEFLTALYKNILGRDPDTGGLDAWTNAIEYGGCTGTEAVYGFVSSDEFKNYNYCNEHYVTYLYRGILGREPDADGLSNWTSALNAGLPRESIMNGFLGSTEFYNRCRAKNITTGSPISVTGRGVIQTWPCALDGKLDNNISQFVLRLYTKCLGRDAEKDGASNWIYAIYNGGFSGTVTAHGFFFSQELSNANLSNTEFIRRLYLTLFNREPDAGGMENWTSVLNSGLSREWAFWHFTDEPEWYNVCASYGITK